MVRDYKIDALKGWAIALVVLGHTIAAVYPNSFRENLLFITLSSFHMPLFMFVSGYLNFGKTTNFATFINKRFTGLIIPYFGWYVIQYLVNYYTGVLKLSFAQSLLNALYFPREGLWFLYVLFLCLIILAVSEKLVKYLGDFSFLLAFLILMVVTTRVFPGSSYFGVDMTNAYFIFVAIGYLSAKHKDSLNGRVLILTGAVLYPILMSGNSFISNQLAYLFTAQHLPFLNLTVTTFERIIALCGIALSYVIIGKIGVTARLPIFGANSLIIYAFHPYLMGVPLFAGPIRVFILTLGSLIVCPLVGGLINKVPIARSVLLGWKKPLRDDKNVSIPSVL